MHTDEAGGRVTQNSPWSERPPSLRASSGVTRRPADPSKPTPSDPPAAPVEQSEAEADWITTDLASLLIFLVGLDRRVK